MKVWAISGLAVLALGLTAIGPDPASAREPREIFAKVLKDYKTIPDARKKLRRKEKKGQPLTGDEYYVMAFGCGYEEPKSQSMILNALSRSGCKDKVLEYYVEAGKRGTPAGFIAAAKRPEAGADAYYYAQLAYQLSGGNEWINNEALGLIADLRGGVANVPQQDLRAQQYAQQLVSAGVYGTSVQPASGAQLAAAGPKLDWLNFSNPAKCGWSDAALNVMEGAWRFDERRARPMVPATVRIPGIKKPVTGRVSRPDRQAPNYAVLHVDFKGRWNGLNVLGLTDAVLEESDGVFGKGIRFAEPVSTVAAKLRAAGFVVNTNGAERVQADRSETVRYTDERGRVRTQVLIDGSLTSIERRNGETVFLCNEVYGWSR